MNTEKEEDLNCQIQYMKTQLAQLNVNQTNNDVVLKSVLCNISDIYT
jgi:hypothetical protein